MSWWDLGRTLHAEDYPPPPIPGHWEGGIEMVGQVGNVNISWCELI